MRPKFDVPFRVIYLLVNLGMLLIIYFGSKIIYSDGPVYTGVMELKAIIFIVSIVTFFVGTISIFLKPFSRIKYPKLSIFLVLGSIISSFFMTCICIIMIIDACSNNYGYCRNWRIFTI